MKISSPKRKRKEKVSAAQNILPFPTANNDPLIPLEKLINWESAINHYTTEVFGTTKGFSPIITPLRKRKGPEGESVWRTPHSKQFQSAEKNALNMESPESGSNNKNQEKWAADSRTLRFRYQGNILKAELSYFDWRKFEIEE